MFFNRKLRDTLFASVSAGTLAAASSALGNPLDPTVVAGDVTITGTGTDHVIIQNDSMRSVVDWDSFSIGAGETTTINQISNSAAILNRVTGGDISKIYGTLESNGQVYLINENGILIGESGLVDTGGFVASTLDVSNADFLGAGDMLFTQGIETGGGITVHGTIRSVTGGDIFLLSREIEVGETGKIESNGGYVGLGAGEEILLRPVDSGDGRISIRAGKGKIVNRGHIEAAAAELRAAGGNEYALAINNTGVIRANGVSKKGGRILLTGGGKVKNTGRVVARKKVVVRSTKKIINKGTVKAGGDKGGEIIFEAPEISVEAGSLLDVSGALGGGRMFVGGGFQGSGADRAGNTVDIAENAQIVTIEAGATLDASATQSGDAGQVIVWSDDATTFAGDIVATAVDGAGGFAEISSKGTLNIAGFGADLAGTSAAGELLLDPTDILVSATTPTGSNVILDSDIETLLEAGTSVTISTGTGVGGASATTDPAGGLAAFNDTGGVAPGDVTFEAGVRIVWTDNAADNDQDALFTVIAAQDILAEDDVIIQHSEVSDTTGTTDVFVDGQGGIRFLAGRYIRIGSAAALRTGGVAVGSEFGQNLFAAGVDFNNTVDYDNPVLLASGLGDVFVTAAGNSDSDRFAQIGYMVGSLRANDTGNDIRNSDGDHARNGTIRVLALGNVSVLGGGSTGGGSTAGSFAQIGHGGARGRENQAGPGGDVAGYDIESSIAEITGEIVVEARLRDVRLYQHLGAQAGTYAKIGHGAYLDSRDNDGLALSQGSISGDITITAGDDVLLNETILLNNNGAADSHLLSQIGHGGNITYTGAALAGDEVSHGMIQGDIAVTAADVLELAVSLSAGNGSNRFTVLSQVGHGGHTQLNYNGDPVANDKTLSVTYGQIANFEDVSGAESAGVGEGGTDITINAGSITLTAVSTTENSAGSTGDVVDNLVRNQIGHGSFTRYSANATGAAFASSETSVPPTTALPTSQATGSYDEEVTYTNVSVTISPAVDLENDDTTLLSQDQQAAIAVYMENNPSATTIPGGTVVNNVTYTEVVTQSPSNVDLDALVAADAGTSCTAGSCDYSDVANADTSGWTAEQLAALQAFITANEVTTTTMASAGSADALDADQLDILISEGDIAGDIFVYDTDSTDDAGVTLTAGIAVGLNAITNDMMLNRIGHGTASYIRAHDGNNMTDGTTNVSNHAGTVTIHQANILGADIVVDTATMNGATEEDDQDISLLTSIVAGLAKAEGNTAVSSIGHGGEILVLTGNGGDAETGNNASGHGGDIAITRGTIWDGTEHYNGSSQADDGYYAYGGSVDVTLRSSDQVIFENTTMAALSKAEANNALSQAGHGSIMALVTGDGGTTSDAGSGGRGGDVFVTWDKNEGRDYGHGDTGYDDTARGIMGDIAIYADHDGTLTGTDGGDGYALDMTSTDQAALAKADHNTDLAQIGHGDFFEIITGDGNDGGDLDTALSGQTNGGRGGDIEVAFADMKIESDITVDVQGAIRAESTAVNALSPEKHGLVETVIGHGSRAYSVAGDGGDGGAAYTTDIIVGYNPDAVDGGGDNGSSQATLRDSDGEILRGGAVGGDGGDIDIAFGDITDRYYVTDGGNTTYYHDGNYELHAQRSFGTGDGVSGDSDADILILATHNESMMSPTDKARSIYLHAEVTHALSEGLGTEANSQIGHNPRIQAQGGLGGDGGSNGNEQVNFDTLQADYSGGNGGDVTISNGFIEGDIQVEAERQVEIFSEAGHEKETVITAMIGHNTHMVAITRAGGLGGDIYTGLGETNNNVQEYWETGDTAGPDTTYLSVDRTSAANNGTFNSYTITYDANGDGDTDDPGDTQTITISNVFSQLNSNDGISTIEDLDGFDFDSAGYLSEFEKLALQAFIADVETEASVAVTNPPLFTLVLQDLNQDDQHSLGDDGSLGTNPDRAADNNSYHDDGIGIVVDGNDAVGSDKEVKTATHALLNGGVDRDLDEGVEVIYQSGVNPDNTVFGDGGGGSDRDNSGSAADGALMVYDRDGDPQFILVDDSGAAQSYYVANTTENRTEIASNGNLAINAADAGTDVYNPNVDNDSDAEFVYSKDLSGGHDVGTFDGVWTYNSDYEGNQDSSTDKFTYVDLNLDRQMDLVDFDADGKFDVVDIDQNGVYDRIDGRINQTGADLVAVMGRDANGNANIIDYTNTTGIDFDASKREGGWSVADLSHADGGRGGNATASVSYTEGDISVHTGNVNFAQNEAYGNGPNADNTSGAAIVRTIATTATDSLIVKTDVQDNIVATGGTEDTVIARVGHGAYQYADTGAEYDDNKVGRTVFFTDTDTHGPAEGGDAGKHALNASGGDGGDGVSVLGGDRAVEMDNDGTVTRTEIDHLVGDIAINTRMSWTDSTIVWDGDDWVSNGGYAFVVDPKGNGIANDDGDNGSRDEKARNESSANRVVVSSKVDNAKGENVGIAQIGHGAISIVDATEAMGGDGESGNGSEIQAHQTEIANGGAGGDATSVAHHVKGDIVVYAGRAPDPAAEITSIEVIAEEGPRIVPGSHGDIVIAQIGHGRIGYTGSGAGGESDDAQWIANGGRGGDATTIQREILDTSIVVNSSDLFGHGMDVFAKAYQGNHHIVRAQIGQGDLNFAESNAGGDAAPSKSSVVEQWNQQANGGRGGDAVALQAGYQYDITVDVGSAPDTEDADKASLRVLTDAQNIFLGTESHILATIGHGGYSHADSAAASGGDGSNRSALGGISVGNSETPFRTYASYREGGRGGNAISEIGLGGTGRVISGRDLGAGVIHDAYLDDDDNGADIVARTHDKSYDDTLYADIEYLFNYGNVIDGTDGDIVILGNDYALNTLLESDGATTLDSTDEENLRADANSDPSAVYGRYDGIKVEALAGPGDSHTRAVDTNTAQIGHSGFNRADALAGEGISGQLAFGRIDPTNADGGKGIQSIFSAKIQEGDGGNGGDAFAYTGSVDGDILVTNVIANEANDIGGMLGGLIVSDGGIDGAQDADTNIVVRATGGTVSGDHRVDARIGHNVASEALTDSNGGNAARPPQPVISFIAAVSSRGGGAGDASSIQGALSGDISVVAENSVIVESKKTTLADDEGFFAGIGHRLENDLEALGQGGISGMIDPAGTVMQATFKDDGDDDRDDATEVGSNQADEQGNLLASYRALYEVKRRMEGIWDTDGDGNPGPAVDYATAYGQLSEYEKSLVAPVLGDPTATGERAYRIIDFFNGSGSEQDIVVSANYYDEHRYPNSLITTYDGTDYNGSEIMTRNFTSALAADDLPNKQTTSDSSIDHRFGGIVNNEGYGSGKDVSGIAGDSGVSNLLTVIFGARDNDAATNGVDNGTTAVNESVYGNIPEPSADEIEALRFVMAASGDGGSVRSIQGTLSGDVSLTAYAYDDTKNDGSDQSRTNARGIYVISNDAALSSSDLFAVVGHGSELIKARGGDAGLHHDTAVQTTASMGGDGGDAIVSQGAASGNISLNSGYVIDIEAQNNGLGYAEEDTRIGHQLKIGSLLEDFSTGTNAAVVAGIGGQDTGLGGDTRNGNGGDVTIDQGGASGSISLSTSAEIATDDGLTIAGADGTVTEVAIKIFADNANISGDDTEVHIGHDQHIDSAQAGDAGRMHALNTYEDNKGLIGVMEGKGGDVTVTQGRLTTDDLSTSGSVEDLTIAAADIVAIKSFVNAGNSRTLIGHDTTAGKEWQVGELDTSVTGNRLVAGNGGDSFVEMFDDVDGGEADGGTVTVTQGAYNDNGTSTNAEDDYYQALDGDIVIRSTYDNLIVLSETGLSGNTYTELGHQLKLSARSGDAGVHRGITQQTAGDGGDVLVTRGRIVGNVTLTALGVDGSNNGTAADGEVFIDAKTGTAAIAKTLLGHGSESILTSGRSGFSQEFETTLYDGIDTATGDAASATQTILQALVEISGKADVNVTDIDRRDAKRLIDNTVAALAMARQYKDRMTAAEQANLDAAYAAAVQAQSDLAGASTSAEVKTAAANASQAISNAIEGADGTFGGVAHTTSDGLRDAGAVYVYLFGDHADGGDIRIDENTDGTAVDAARIIGDVTVTGNATEGTVRVQGGYGTGSMAVAELGHRLRVKNTSGEGGGETDGAPPDGGEAGDGGNISLSDNVSGNVALSADELVITADGSVMSVTHLGHDTETMNFAGMSDIFDQGLGNGGTISTAQTVGGNVSLAANHVSDVMDTESGKLTISGIDSTLRLGHLASQWSESDDDGKVSSPANSPEYNRAGDIGSSQSVSGNVTVDLGLGGDITDLIIDAGGTETNQIQIMHDATQFAFSGKFGGNGLNDGANDPTDGDGSFIAADGDGQMVTLSQAVSGDFSVSGLEDLQVTSAGGGLNIGHNAYNTGISGEVAPTGIPGGDDYGERVDADQAVSGAIALAAGRSVTIEDTGGSNDLQVGHSAEQTAKSADDGGDHDTEEGYRDGNGDLVIADVDADQTISGVLSITSGEILLASATTGKVQYGHHASQITDTDLDTGIAPGHIEANSTIGDGNGSADMTLTANASNVPADNSAIIASTPVGTITMDGDNGTLQFGHSATTTTGHTESGTLANGSVDTEQSILADIAVNADEDLIMTADAATAFTIIGHTIAELNTAMGTATGEGHENTYADADSVTQVSDAGQLVAGDITVNTGDSLSVDATAAGAEVRIGHDSEYTNGSDEVNGGSNVANVAQIGVSDQKLTGDITIEVGTDGDGAANGTVVGNGAAGDDDDALIQAVPGGIAGIGHNMVDSGDNEVQIAAGDIWLRVGADLHVTAGRIGHDEYDFDHSAADQHNSYDLTVAKAAALAAGVAGADMDVASMEGAGTIRNRIQGNTTIGASQNSPSQDSVVLDNVMKFDGGPAPVRINSGYGGQGNADVDGELRFFIPAQQNLTTIGTVVFNDSASDNGAVAVPVTGGAGDPSNIFADRGGNDHEHDFTFMSAGAPYTDALIGLGNFTFYFEGEQQQRDFTYFPEYTPYINLIDLDPGFAVTFDSEGGPEGQGAVNMGELAGENYLGTSSFDIDCEEDQAGTGTPEENVRPLGECERIHTFQQGSPAGLGSNWGFSATAGGNQTFGHGLPDDLEEAANNGSFGYAIPVSPELRQPVMIAPQRFTANQNGYGVMTVRQSVATPAEPVMTSAYAPVIAGSMNETEISFAPGDSYGEYITGESINRDMQQASYPEAISYASSYTVFVQRPL